MLQMTPCNKCGLSNYFGAKFCTRCGEKLQYQCPNCRISVEPGIRFCSSCGIGLDWGLDTKIEPSIYQKELPQQNVSNQFKTENKIEVAADNKQQSRNRGSSNKWLIIFIIALILIVALFIADMFLRGPISAGFLNTPPVPSTGEQISVSAETLYFSYISDKMAAQSRFDDKVLIVKGSIGNIGITTEDIPFVVILGGIDSIGIYCLFENKFINQIKQLTLGKSIMVRGLCDGYYGSNVQLNNCTFLN